MQLRLKNVPISEPHIVGIILGVLLHYVFRRKTLLQGWIGRLIGCPLVVLGTGLSLWAAIEAGKTDISSPERLVTTGPYAHTRNPMYLGWSLVYVGVSFIVNSIWLMGLFPFVMAYMHFADVRGEERFLETEFGSRYRDYRDEVPRYL